MARSEIIEGMKNKTEAPFCSPAWAGSADKPRAARQYNCKRYALRENATFSPLK